MSESLVIEVVRKTITVDCTVEEAFRVFTSEATSQASRATRSTGRSARSCSSRAPAAASTRSLVRSTGTGRRCSSGSLRTCSSHGTSSSASAMPPRSRCGSCPTRRERSFSSSIAGGRMSSSKARQSERTTTAVGTSCSAGTSIASSRPTRAAPRSQRSRSPAAEAASSPGADNDRHEANDVTATQTAPSPTASVSDGWAG